jgi:hypothetical protein
LFLIEGKCSEECPTGYYQNYKTHECEKTRFDSGAGGPLYLILTLIGSSVTIIVSHIRTGKKDITSSIILFFLTQIEFLNRIILLACLWKTTQVFSFSLTGMNLLGTSLFGIYFVTNVVHPLANQLNLEVFQSKSFTGLTVLSQFSGVNTLRLTTSRFFLLRPCCLPTQYATLPYYVRHLESINGMTLSFTACQFFVGIGCLRLNPLDSAPYAFGLNAVIFNILLFGFQAHKYRRYMRVSKEYAKVD